VRSNRGPDLPTAAAIAVAAVMTPAGGDEVIERGSGAGGLMTTLPAPADVSTKGSVTAQQADAIDTLETQHEAPCAAGWPAGM
jgi:hypothetical protein